MTPLQLTRLLCAIATARNVARVQLVAMPAAASGMEWQTLSRSLPYLLGRHCNHYAGYERDSSLTAIEGLVNQDGEVPRESLTPVQNSLLVVPYYSTEDGLALNKTLTWDFVSRLFWVVVCREDLVTDAIQTLPWPLANKILLLSVGAEASVWEVYRPAPHVPPFPILLTPLSLAVTGPTEQQLNILLSDPWYRRSNLTGLVLRCRTMEYTPYNIIQDNPDDTITLTGVFGDLWDNLQQMLGFTIRTGLCRGICQRPRDGTFGYGNLTTGLWTGVLGELHRGETDISPTGFVVTSDRSKGVHFSKALVFSFTIMIIQRPSRINGGSNYTQEFSTVTWLLIFIFFVLCVLMMLAFTHSSKTETNRDLSYSFVTNIRIFCNMGYSDELPVGAPYRYWLLTVVVLVMVLQVYYSAFMMSILASGHTTLPFTDLAGFYQARDKYTLGIVKDSSIVSKFKYSMDPIQQKLWPDIVQEPEWDGINRVKSDKYHVYMMDYDYYMAKFRSCELMALPTKYFMSSVAMPLKPHGAVNPIINIALDKIYEGGLYKHMETVWVGAKDDPSNKCEADPVAPLGLSETYTAFLLLAIGGGIAVVILLGEWSREKYWTKAI